MPHDRPGATHALVLAPLGAERVLRVSFAGTAQLGGGLAARLEPAR
jgi:hypothetical protein